MKVREVVILVCCMAVLGCNAIEGLSMLMECPVLTCDDGTLDDDQCYTHDAKATAITI